MVLIKDCVEVKAEMELLGGGQGCVQFEKFSTINDELPKDAKSFVVGPFESSTNSLSGIIAEQELLVNELV